MQHAFVQAAVVFLILSLFVSAQADATKPEVRSNPLTAEQIAIYRAVLDDYMKDSAGVLNVADTTEPLDQSGFGFDEGCVKNIQVQPDRDTVTMTHKLDLSLVRDKRFKLVDPGHQQEKIKQNDPQGVVKGVIDDHRVVTDKQLDRSVSRAFQTGMLTLSEILFDKQQRHALVSYSFVCGELCGNGNLLALTKVGHKWKVTKRCGGWVS